MKKYMGILGLLTVTVIWGGGFDRRGPAERKK